MVESFSFERGGFVPLAYRLGLAEASGLLTVSESGARHALWLRRGQVTRIIMDDAAWAPLGQAARDALASGHKAGAAVRDALGRHVEQRLERLAAAPGGSATLEREVPPAVGPHAQVSLALWARRHAEARLDAMRVKQLEAELAGVRLTASKHLLPVSFDLDDDDLSLNLDDPLCDATDLRIIRALASPRRLDELERASRAPRHRLLAFVHFLRTVGALQEGGVAARGVSRGHGEARPQ